MSLLPTPPSPPRPRLPRKFFAWLLAATVLVTLAAFVARSVLIRQMKWPRLVIAQSGNVIAVAITPDGNTIFTGNAPDVAHLSGDKPADVFVWESASGRLVRRLRGFYWRSNAVTSSPDGSDVIASGFTEPISPKQADSHTIMESILSWDWKTGRQMWARKGSMPLSYSPDRRLIGCSDGIHTASDGKLVFRIPRDLSSDSQSEFSPDGNLFGFIGAPTLNKKGFADSDDGDRMYYSTTRLHLWHTDTGKKAKDFPFTRVRAFDIARNGQWLIIAADRDGMGGGTDGSVVRRVDMSTGTVSWTRERSYNAPSHDPDAVLNSVTISPNGKYVVVQSTDGRLIVLDAETGRELFRPISPQSSGEPQWAIPGGLAFSADGRTLISRCGSKVLVWDASSLR